MQSDKLAIYREILDVFIITSPCHVRTRPESGRRELIDRSGGSRRSSSHSRSLTRDGTILYTSFLNEKYSAGSLLLSVICIKTRLIMQL